MHRSMLRQRGGYGAASHDASTPTCKCGRPAARRTSQTAKNPNRVFFSCGKCKFFIWEDAVKEDKAVGSREFATKITLASGVVTMKISLATEPNKFVIDFGYCPTLISIIKHLHPSDRGWNPAKKFWTVQATALPQLLDLLTEDADVDRCKIPTSLRQTATTAAAAAAAVPVPTSSYIAGTGKRTFSDYDTEDDFSGGGVGGGEISKRARGPAARMAVPTECPCEHPWERTNGKHMCRYFGKFQCSNCHNRWSSAYIWSDPVTGVDEVQNCRRCNTEALPIHKQPRASDRCGGGIQGAHDEGNCGMCRKLGRPCNDRGGGGTGYSFGRGSGLGVYNYDVDDYD